MSALPRYARNLVGLGLVVVVVVSLLLLAPRSAELTQKKDEAGKGYEAPIFDCDSNAIPNQYFVTLAPKYGFEEHRGLIADRGRSTQVLRIEQSGNNFIYLVKILDDASLAAIRADKMVDSVQCAHLDPPNELAQREDAPLIREKDTLLAPAEPHPV